MDKIKKFITDNKGCPLTVPAIKQLLVKFIEGLSEEGLGEFLNGNPTGKVLKAIQDNSLMCDYIYILGENDKLVPVNEVPENYTGIAYTIGSDGLYVEYFTNGVYEKSNYIHPAGITIDGIDFIQKVTKFDIQPDFDDAGQDIGELYSRLKIGDILYSYAEGTTATITDKTVDTVVISVENINYKIYYTYKYEAEYGWVLDDTTEYYSGSLLYKHHVVDESNGYELDFITNNPHLIDFTIIDTQLKLYNYLKSNGLTSMYVKNDYDYSALNFNSNDNFFYSIMPHPTTGEPLVAWLDDLDLTHAVDTVTRL